MNDDAKLRRKRIAFVVLLVGFLATVAVLVLLHGHTVLAFLTDGQRVQQQVERLGALAPFALGVLVVLQEVTVVVPSEPLELAAGYAFGFWEGAAIYLAASVVGCLAIIGIVHVAGERVLRLFLTPKRRAQLQDLRKSQRFDLAILVAFFIPGLPKDILAYAAALAGMSPAHLVVVTTLGRMPSVVAATLASSYAAQGDWKATLGVFAITAPLALAGLLVYRALRRHVESKSHAKP